MTAISSRKQRSGTNIRLKPETTTPRQSLSMLASCRKRKSWSYISWKELVFISLFIASLLSSITLFRLATLSDWDADHQYLLIDPRTPPSASLAYRQSYGFFNDILDHNWRLLQQRAQRAHKIVEYEPQLIPGNSPSTWYPNDLEPDFTCPHMTRVGGTWICDPHRLLERDCVVYSIGSNGTYEWEDALIDLLGSKHCEIHVFDPGNYARVGDPDLNNIHYHQWGLKSSYDRVFNAKLSHVGLTEEVPKLQTFQYTLKDFNEEDRRIDILKIDCFDKCEWSTYKDWFTADIRQIVIKTHGAPYYIGGTEWHSQMLAADFFDFFTAQRYAMFSKAGNVHDRGESLEFGFVKLHPDFWKHDSKDFSVDRQMTLQLQKLPERLTPMNPPAPFKIPRRLILVAETLISKTEDPVESFFNEVQLIDMFKEAWGDPLVPTWILDILTCNAAIFKAKRELVPVFRAETDVSKQLDMCRVAALYLSGGYQIDIDLEVRSIPNTPDNTGLLIAREGDVVSKRFIAAEPECDTIKTALDYMVELSKQNQTRPDFDLVTEALSLALARVPDPDPSAQAVFVSLETIGGDVSTPWIVTDQPVYSFNNPVPLEIRGPSSPEYKIPRRLIFTHKHNLLETKDPPLLYENVQKTIQTYRDAWGEPEAPVWFLNDTDCRSAIYAAKPNLLVYFDREAHGSWKADICRVAALYLTGGYYFDADMEALYPWVPDNNVAFATATNPENTSYFQSFLASERKGRILEKALDAMLLFYMNKKTRIMALLGPDTLNWAIRSVPVSEQGKMVLLKEVEAIQNEPDTPLRPNAVGCCCNFVVQDPATNQTLFYSRVVGGGNKCMFRDSDEGQAWLAEDALQKKI